MSSGKFILLLLVACVPLIGQIVLTVLILKGARSRPSGILWAVAVWLVPHLGPLAYVLFGQPGTSMQIRLIAPLVLVAVALAGFLLVAAVYALLH
jgi:Phospholipase_D-nuclease N-terminal